MKQTKFYFFTLITFLFALSIAKSQEEATNKEEKATIESVKETTDGLSERTTTLENDIATLKKLKVSGYVQTDWLRFDQKDNVGGKAFYSDARKNYFTIRRGRVKFQYKAGDFNIVLQPDISEQGVTIKDAYGEYAVLPNDEMKLTFGAFNRPNYEVELSSSQREAAERSQVTRAFYPGERDLGMMLTYNKEFFTDFAPKLQLGVFNGAGPVAASETDPYKDIIGRLTFGLPLGSESPVQIDLGASMYYGGTVTKDSVIKFVDTLMKQILNDETGENKGFGSRKNFNVEAQLYLDLLPIGGTILRGEMMTGSRTTPNSKNANIIEIRNQSGIYAYLVQNIFDEFQVAARYDVFDKNTDISGATVKSAADSKVTVLGFGLNWIMSNLKIMLWHELPQFDKDELGITEDVKDTKTTVRFQFKF